MSVVRSMVRSMGRSMGSMNRPATGMLDMSMDMNKKARAGML
jgi:hypothetical protein